MNLLLNPEGSGYPAEYLIARIQGRRARLVKKWDDILSGPAPAETLLPAYYKSLVAEYTKEGVWKYMLKEFRWVYLQMNRGLRNIFNPFFIYSETKTIVLCLRHKIEKETSTKAEDILLYSLLSREVKEVLGKEAELALLLEEFEKKFISSMDGTTGLKEIFAEEGLKGVEEKVVNVFMHHIISLKLHPVSHGFFVFLIDIKNIMTLYKHERWAIKTDPVFIQGGSISESMLRKTIQEGGITPIIRLIHQRTGISIHEPGASEIENTLFAGLTKYLKLKAREGSGAALILDYLWKIYTEARNFSILLYSRDIEKVHLRKELVIL
ncbi:MAG: V-type ATPase subunit [Nitrospiraceae bacterium]|nr:MAG: V-type ATPase subunit [Nitrospiraceae bacterium]